MAAAYMDVKFSYTRYQLTMSLIYLVHFTSNVIEVMMHEVAGARCQPGQVGMQSNPLICLLNLECSLKETCGYMKIVAFIAKSFIFSTDRDLVSVMLYKNKQILWQLCQILLLYAL